MPFVGGLARRMGPKYAIATGSAIYSGGYLLTYLTVQYHFSGAIFSLSLHGLAFCFVYATTIRTAQAWFPPARKGLVTSIVVSGYGFGSSLWAPIQTELVNHENLKAGSDMDRCGHEDTENKTCTDTEKYFTDPMVLDRVPFMFLILGIIYAVMGFIAVLLIAEPKGENIEDNEDEDKENEVEKIAEERNLTPWEVLKTRWFYHVNIFRKLELTNHKWWGSFMSWPMLLGCHF